jgi:hypothetical protein
MKRVLGSLCSLLLFVVAAEAFAATVTVDLTNRSIAPGMRTLPVRVVGRVQIAPLPAPLPAGATAYTHEWPGVYFETAFVGDRLVLKFDDGWHEYRLTIDDEPSIALVRPGRAEVVVSDLTPGPHRARLEKVSESFKVRGTFAGFYAAGKAVAQPVAKARQIEFIGPSGMTGFGVRSPKPECTFEELHATTDTQQAYTVLVAKHFGADYQVNASSGRGLIRNVKDARAERTLTELYPFVFSDLTVPYEDPNWRPRIIEIQPFADFAAGEVEPGERWKTLEDLTTAWVSAFDRLIADLHRRSPGTTILVAWPEDADINPPEYRPAFAKTKSDIAAAARREGVGILFPPFYRGPLESTGCGHHGSLKDNQALAKHMIDYIEARPELWGGR